MILETGLYSLVCLDPTVSLLIASRIYPLLLPDSPLLPAATYQRVSTVTDQTMNSIVSLTIARVQFDTWAAEYATAKQVADALNSVLEGYTGPLPNGVMVANVTLDSQFDFFESQSLRYRVSSDYMVQFYR